MMRSLKKFNILRKLKLLFLIMTKKNWQLLIEKICESSSLMLRMMKKSYQKRALIHLEEKKV